MARLRAVEAAPSRPVSGPISGPWRLAVTPAGSCAGPGDLPGPEAWIPAEVPGTAAAALRAAGRWHEDAPAPLHGFDVWYRARLDGRGRERLRFEGLATLAEVWLDGVPVLAARSMFLAHEVEVELTGAGELAICFRALAAELARPHRRGRWRPRLATPGSLRHVRTTLLGFMPGWCPPVDHVGPYRPVTRAPAGAGAFRVAEADLRATLDGGTGRLALRLRVEGGSGPARLLCDGRMHVLEETAPGAFSGTLDLPGVAPWWPHTHGEPRLHAVAAEVGGRRLDLGRVGFRTVTLTRPLAEGLALAVNGVPVFCRGACWLQADLVGLSGEAERLRPLLALAREAGMNMLRVPGVALYESDAFFDLCDEFGILVWHDLMLANFDYPLDEPAFRDGVSGEVAQFLDRTQASPALCVVAGGSEVFQQAAMLGFPRQAWAGGEAEAILRAAAAAKRPDLVVVPNSPSGGDLPFDVSAGVAHYYGVGAYRRPLEDARRAAVGFAAECLAFSNVPDDPASRAGLARAGLDDPRSGRWRAAVPRDRGADWDFEDVRDHYVRDLFGCDPEALRAADPDRYRALARAAVAEVMEATFAEWRRAASPTAGALVWTLRDLAPGAGWGVIDADGRPKSAWYALRRAFRPVQVGLSDEGLNGLHVHVHNEGPAPLDAVLHLAFTAPDGRAVARAERAVALPPRASRHWTSADLLGRFLDVTGAYRFGPLAHDLGHARLAAPDGATLAEAFHFPAGRDPAPRAVGLRAGLVRAGAGWAVRVGAERHALCVRIEAEGDLRPEDDGFHLAPGAERCVALVGTGVPRGTVRALNAAEAVAFAPRPAGAPVPHAPGEGGERR